MFKQNMFFSEKTVPGSEAAHDKWLVQKKGHILRKSSAPGSEAAWDKWFLLRKVNFLETVLPQAAKLPRTSGFFKKNDFWKKVPPQAAKLPRTSSFLKTTIL